MKDIEELRKEAFLAKDLLRHNVISYDEAKVRITPWLNAFNAVAKEKAKKYGVKAYKVSFASFIR